MFMTFELFLSYLSNLDKIQTRQDPDMELQALEFITALREIPNIDSESLAEFIYANPNSIPLIATAGGLGQEQLKNQLKFRFMTHIPHP